MWAVVVLLVSACVVHIQGALPLPPYIKACGRSDPNFNICALQHARDALPQIVKGDKKYKVPPLDPMDIEEVKVVSGGPRSASLNLNLRKAKVYGLRHTHVDRLGYDFDKRHIHHEVSVPRVEIIGQYDVTGRILLLPVNGSGGINITLDNVKVVYDEDYHLQTRDGVRYLVPENPKATAVPSRMHIHVTRLFNGDALLNKQMNAFLNENWRDVFDDLSPTVFQVFTQIVFRMISNLDNMVPFDVAFPGSD